MKKRVFQAESARRKPNNSPKKRKMIPTNCAACAAPLAHDAPKCARCKVRYCNRTCQMDHWRRGHKQICKEIHRGGNAEQYHADKKYKEAVAVAVAACAKLGVNHPETQRAANDLAMNRSILKRMDSAGRIA